jgi:ElaB/YqjD/DUF883 family membrane-anchored ribosome-binding protein
MGDEEAYAPVAAILQEMIGASETAARAEQAFAAAEEARDRAGVALNEAHGRLSGLQRQLVSAQQHRLAVAVDAEVVEDDPAIYCDPHEMPEEAPAGCTPDVFASGPRWAWHCRQHAVGDFGCDTEGAARLGGAAHAALGL